MLCALRATLARRSRLPTINPRYRTLLEEAGLREVDDFIRLPADIVCGHRNRHTARLTLGDGPNQVRAFLKREQYTYWRDYVSSVWAGMGWGSRSCREARMLQALQAAGLPGPEFIAAGADERGRAFLLVRELERTQELREVLREHAADAGERRRLARRLGRTLARVHDAGFRHVDLYSKHVHVDLLQGSVHFLDWQRAQRRRWLGWQSRLRDLAALDATLHADLAGPRERLDCLRSYLSASQIACPPSLAQALADLRRHANRLLRKRHVREAREAPLAFGVQNLVWVDGEALCVTREFLDSTGGRVPEWLSRGRSGGPQKQPTVQAVDIPLPPGDGKPGPSRRAILSRSGTSRPWHWLWCLLRGRPVVSPEMRQAACLFRLQRYGLPTPRLLAVGQSFRRPWCSDSFLLIEPAQYHGGLAEWLLHLSWNGGTRERQTYRRLLRESGSVLRRLHESGCFLPACSTSDLDGPFAVARGRNCVTHVVVRNVAELRQYRKPRRRLAWSDLTALYARFSAGLISRTDALRFLLAYLEIDRLNDKTRSQLRAWLGRRP